MENLRGGGEGPRALLKYTMLPCHTPIGEIRGLATTVANVTAANHRPKPHRLRGTMFLADR